MRSFWCLCFILTLPAESFTEEKKAEEVNGILGESVTFHLKTLKRPTSIFWIKVMKNDPKNIALVEEGQPCRVKVILQKYAGRLNVSTDCRSLQITNLHQDDSGQYNAQINDSEFFMLEVYKNLSESDLRVHCKKDPLGNYTELNCSAGNWGKGVNYNWSSTSKNEKTSSHVIQIQDSEANYTCTAENPVSKASKTVSIKEACEANPTTGPGTVPTGTGENKQPSLNEKLIAVWIVLAIVSVAAACIGCVLWKRHKKAAHGMPPDSPDCTVPDESCKTIYAQIDCLPSETQQTGMKKPQPQRRPKAQEGIHTIYSSVQPKPTDDSAIKTVYDTVNAPKRPEGSEFRKLL